MLGDKEEGISKIKGGMVVVDGVDEMTVEDVASACVVGAGADICGGDEGGVSGVRGMIRGGDAECGGDEGIIKGGEDGGDKGSE